MAVVEGEIVRAGGGVEKSDFADNAGEAPDEEGERAGCERGMYGVVEWDLGDELGDEAGVGLGGVDAVLGEVEAETVGGEGERGGGGEERVADGGGVRGRCRQRGEVASQTQLVHRRRRERG